MFPQICREFLSSNPKELHPLGSCRPNRAILPTRSFFFLSSPSLFFLSLFQFVQTAEMICKTHLLLFLALSIIPIFITAHSSSKCHQTCGHNNTAKRRLFPFIGTSSDCLIRLNCSKNGDLTVGDEFPVQNIGAETLLIKLEKGCNRRIESMDHLFNSNYAPTTRNGFLLRHCKSAASKCPIPTTKVNTHFDSTDCGPDNSSIACYAEESENGFLSFANVSARNCLYLFSSILVDTFNESSVVLDVGIVQLGWWLLGECNCHREAKCTNIQPVSGQRGFRCKCREGFHGDGYQAGEGCRKGKLPLEFSAFDNDH